MTRQEIVDIIDYQLPHLEILFPHQEGCLEIYLDGNWNNVLTPKEVKELTSLTTEELESLNESNLFPDPIFYGDIFLGWLESDVKKWIEEHKNNEDLINRKLCDEYMDSSKNI